MKRILCSLMLLFAMSTMGLLVGSKSASAGSVTFAELKEVLQNSEWEGTWEENEYFNSGAVEILLTIIDEGTVYVWFSMFDTGDGDWTNMEWGTINGNTMTLTSRYVERIFLLARESGALVLKGKYKVTSGQYVGETGTYSLKKKE